MRVAIAGSAALVLLVAFGAFWLGWSQFVVRQRTAEISRQVVALAAAERTSPLTGGSESVRDSLFRVEAGLLGATLLVTDDAGAVERNSDERVSVQTLDLTRLGAPDAGGSAPLPWPAPAAVRCSSSPHRSATAANSSPYSGFRRSAPRRPACSRWRAACCCSRLLSRGSWVAGSPGGSPAPLVRLEAGAERIAAGEFGATVPEEGDAETVSLARSFNRMSERVALAYDAQRSFVGDVSHEIRTPLTSISGFAGALLDGTISDPAAQERALGVIRDEARRIQDLSDTLLALAQLDAGAVELAREPVDMNALGTALQSRFEAPAASHQVALEVSLVDERAPLVSDPERLLQAASTLVSNALAHAPKGGRVVVSSQSGGGLLAPHGGR